MSIQLKTFAEGIFISAFMLLCCSSTLAQKKVTGKVLNANDQLPIAGASVQIKGGDVGTNTDENGNFSISARDPNAVLVISYVGYTSLETSLAGKSSLGNLLLSSTSSNLNEVVVTGYTSQRKKDITGSVAVVNVADLKTQPTGTTESLLQGQAAGVTIVNSGAPGGPSNIRVRGITSVGSTEPLVIIDGAYGSLHDLNVNDVQSIQVLKDAGAAAIYGVRGSNGVVIVTTKRGRSGKARIEYDGYYGTQQPLKRNV